MEMNKIAIKELKDEGYDLFFNFPNRKSQPGNLKMGWKKVMKFDESLAFNNFPKVIKDMTHNPIFELGGKVLSMGMSDLDKIIETLSNKVNLNGMENKVSLESKFCEDVENL